MPVSVTMPRLGESVTEGTVTRWLKQEGERVEADEPLLEVSTDKVDTEIPSPASGVLQKIIVGEDETVDVGAELAVIGDGSGGDDGGGQADDQAASESQQSEPESEPPPSPSSPMMASSAPTSTVSSSSTLISSSVPATGEGISVSTLSVETSSSGSSTSTVSPTDFSQRVMVPSVTDSPSAGRVTEVAMRSFAPSVRSV